MVQHSKQHHWLAGTNSTSTVATPGMTGSTAVPIGVACDARHGVRIISIGWTLLGVALIGCAPNVVMATGVAIGMATGVATGVANGIIGGAAVTS